MLMEAYRQIRNKVTALNIKLKRQYYTDKIYACEDHMKETWKIVNQVLNKRSNSSNIDSFKGSGSDLEHKKDSSNTMNEFFCSVGKDLADDFAPAPNFLLSGNYEVNANKAKFHLKTIDVQEIRGAFAKIKASKSFGIDNVSCYCLKLVLPFIENFIAGLPNTSLVTSQLPDLKKIARAFEEGDRSDRGNYQPISVLPIISSKN